MIIKIVGRVYGEKDGNNRGMFETFGVPIKVVVTGGDGVEGRTKGGDVNQVSTRPVLLETQGYLLGCSVDSTERQVIREIEDEKRELGAKPLSLYTPQNPINWLT